MRGALAAFFSVQPLRMPVIDGPVIPQEPLAAIQKRGKFLPQINGIFADWGNIQGKIRGPIREGAHASSVQGSASCRTHPFTTPQIFLVEVSKSEL